MSIHPTAIIGKDVQIGKDTEIGPYTVIEDSVKIGTRNKILTRVYICSGTTIGDDNEIHMGAVIGNAPQDLSYKGAPTETKIGNSNVIREYVTIHRATKEGSPTTVGNNNFIMAFVHIAHDCQIGNQTILANGATHAGHCKVEDQVFLSGITLFHQFTRIGRLAMVSGMSALNQDLPPFMTCGGRPATVYALNVIGMRRAGIKAETRDEIKRAYKLLYRDGLNTGNAIAEIEKTCSSPEVKYLLDFVKSSKRGIVGAKTEEEETESLRF